MKNKCCKGLRCVVKSVPEYRPSGQPILCLAIACLARVQCRAPSPRDPFVKGGSDTCCVTPRPAALASTSPSYRRLDPLYMCIESGIVTDAVSMIGQTQLAPSPVSSQQGSCSSSY
jgi:hypothetical protein